MKDNLWAQYGPVLPEPAFPAAVPIRDRTPVTCYFDRYRGETSTRNVFAFYARNDQIIFHIEPIQYAQTPSELFEKLVSDGNGFANGATFALLIGGHLSRALLSVSVAKLDGPGTEELLVRGFATRQTSSSTNDRLADFLLAKLSIDSPRVRTVGDLLLAYGYRP
jgi:hypothetical protein